MQRLALHSLDMYPISATGKRVGALSRGCGSFADFHPPARPAMLALKASGPLKSPASGGKVPLAAKPGHPGNRDWSGKTGAA